MYKRSNTPSDLDPNSDSRLPRLGVWDGHVIPEAAVVRFCVAAYSQMLDLEVRALEEAARQMSSAPLRHDLETTDLPLLADFRDLHRERLHFWSQQLADSPDGEPHGRDGR
jgi:hypothetical protein